MRSSRGGTPDIAVAKTSTVQAANVIRFSHNLEPELHVDNTKSGVVGQQAKQSQVQHDQMNDVT